MSAVEAIMFQRLSADPIITSIVPADRIVPIASQIQNLAFPNIKHGPIIGTPIRTQAGLAVTRMYDIYQVSCYASTLSACRTLAEAVIAGIDGPFTIGDGSKAQCLFQNERQSMDDPDFDVVHIPLEFLVIIGS